MKQITTLYMLEQNGVVKRKNSTSIENMQCMLQHMKLDHKFWAKIVVIVTYIQNWIPTKNIYNMTLQEVWCGYKASISHLHVFGCAAFVHVPKEIRTKLDSKGVKCIFIGYCEKTKGYILYNLISQFVIINHGVIFHESKNFNAETMVWRLAWIKTNGFKSEPNMDSFVEGLNGENSQTLEKGHGF